MTGKSPAMTEHATLGGPATPPLIELTDIVKTFGGVQALRGVDFGLKAGSIHGLAGENGAGKSTLMKVIAGVHAPDSGEFKIDGAPVHFRSARDVIAHAVESATEVLEIIPTSYSVGAATFGGVVPPIPSSSSLLSPQQMRDLSSLRVPQPKSSPKPRSVIISSTPAGSSTADGMLI